jgi:hypothetical protein
MIVFNYYCYFSFYRVLIGTVIIGVSLNRLLDGNRIGVYGRVNVVHGYVWRTLCSVCATGARVARPVPCNS